MSAPRLILLLLRWTGLALVLFFLLFCFLVFGDCFDAPCRRVRQISYAVVIGVTAATYLAGVAIIVRRWAIRKGAEPMRMEAAE